MNAEFQQEAAMLWWKILRQDPTAIFGAEARRLLNRNWGDQIPQPGYVGPAYVAGGLAFVSMNPGGMRGDGLGPTDRMQLEALKRLRDCSRPNVVRAFVDLRSEATRIMLDGPSGA